MAEEGREKEKERELSKKEEMAPWEQHSTVISIPRFDYNAPSSLLQHSHSGFLITCPIKREKSATKEAISLLAKYVQCFNRCSSEEEAVSKRRKLSKENRDGEEATANSGDAHDDVQEGPPLPPAKVDAEGDTALFFRWLSLQRVVCFSLPSPKTLLLTLLILWCHRIFPIQATCSLNEKELHEVVSKLVLQFLNNNQKLARPIKFAVGYNRRGVETELNTSKEASNAVVLLDRDKCFEIVASAVTGVVSDSVVDLKSPELAVLIELLPLSGVPKESLVVAVSVLPRNVVSVKPRLCIKALVSDTKTKGKKN
ncbi:uncharacterized protein Pyn_27258 [Prunus yedoensis var. nudiflora]|uniref:THUMP domain-containing protein n=1 Tax=Prunus yedoensis var. nudiflora TaxID=2094558 RepID=A0A314XVM2_PRUYE|nr:uncharacterized protein Pyn_27258 [Prunus yedoensis var. nudiflora]